ncbi:MAG: hypothetical protein Q4G64_00800 [bacterium]|nr:hypothetical protein [bacterium]
MSEIRHFLLVFDHKIDKLIDQRDFNTNLEAATEAYAEAEAKYRDDPLKDIVLVGSDSIETVRVTHSTYFDGMGRSLIEKALARAAEGMPNLR